MDRLILLRHGTAEPESATGDDFARRLTSRGTRDTDAIAGRLAEMGFQPQIALVSAATRTCETWAAAQPHFPGAELRVRRDLYLADSEAVRRAALEAGEECSAVLVVGHNPGLQELAIQLLQEGSAPAGLIAKAQRDFPPAAAAVFLLDANGRPHFDGLFFPER